MAYGRTYRRRLGRGRGYKRGDYASTMGLVPVAGGRKRRRPPTYTGTSAVPRMGRRVRTKLASGYSFTKTTRTKKRLYRKPVKRGDNSSFSQVSWGSSYMSPATRTIMKKLTNMQTEGTHNKGFVQSNVGQQAMTQWIGLQYVDLQAMMTKANGGSATITNEVSLFIRYMKRRLLIRNQTNTVGKLTLYDLSCRNQPTSTAANDPIDCFSKGYTDMGLTNHHLQVGVSPFKSPEFKRFWTVKRVTVVDIEPGQQHEHIVYRKVNRYFKSSQMEYMTQGFIGGLTSCVLAVFHGGLGHQNGVPADVSYMQMKIDWTDLLEINYGFITQVLPSYTYTNNIPTTITNFDFTGESNDANTDNIMT